MESVINPISPQGVRAPQRLLALPQGSDPRDCVSLSGQEPPPSDIPDAEAILANPDNRYVRLNMNITRSYGRFSEMFQEVIGDGYPTWFAIGAFAARSAGKGMLAAQAALAVISDGGSFTQRFPDLDPRDAARIAERINAVGGGEERLAATFLAALWLGMSRQEGVDWRLFDPRVLRICTKRLLHLVREAPGDGLKGKLTAVARTVTNGLEDGNRRIFADIGVAAQRFLEYRRDAGPGITADRILREFSLSNPPRPAQAEEMYRFGMDAAAAGGPIPSDFRTRFPMGTYDLSNLLVAAFAMYTEAGACTDAALRNRIVATANNLMAWREQFETVQPAFTPPATYPGEVSRPGLFGLLTPAIVVPFRFGTWRYSRFAAEHLPPRDHNPLTPRVTEYHWGDFDDRWIGILNAFDSAYAHHDAIFPMPDPDPMRPLQGLAPREEYIPAASAEDRETGGWLLARRRD